MSYPPNATGLLMLIACAASCARAAPVCQRIFGRWQGERVEGVEGAATERVARMVERDGRWVVRLAREAATSERTIELEVTAEGALRALTPSRDERVPAVVLRRIP